MIKGGIIVIILVIGLVSLLFVFKILKLPRTEMPKNEIKIENTTQENKSAIEQEKPYSGVKQFKLAFFINSSRNPEEKIYIHRDFEDSKIQEYLDAINKTRNDLRNFISRASNSDLTISLSEEDKIGINSANFPILAGSNIKTISLNTEIKEDSVSFTPEIRYTDKENKTIENSFSINEGKSKTIWIVRIGWENKNSSIETSSVIKLITNLEEDEQVYGKYNAYVYFELKNTTVPKNTNITSTAEIRILGEANITIPKENIIITNKSELEDAINSEDQIIFLGADWIINHLDKSCKGIAYPGVENIGVAEYSSSKLNKALSDPEFAKKEGMSCPLKKVTEKNPKVTFVKN